MNMRVHSNLPKTARRTESEREKVMSAHSRSIGDENAVEQEERREAKAAITLQQSAHKESSSLGPVHGSPE